MTAVRLNLSFAFFSTELREEAAVDCYPAGGVQLFEAGIEVIRLSVGSGKEDLLLR